METQQDVADYILSHAIELRGLAQGAKLDLLAYFLDLVISEADSIVMNTDIISIESFNSRKQMP